MKLILYLFDIYLILFYIPVEYKFLCIFFWKVAYY